MKQAKDGNATWTEDPRSNDRLPEDQQSQIPEYRRHWGQIRTRFARGHKLLNWYNFRLSSLDPEILIQQLHQVFNDQDKVFKLNISFGFLLRNIESNQLQYHYASRNNNNVFDEPFQISTFADVQPVNVALRNLDILEWARQLRPNSKWIVDQVTNVTYFVTKVVDHPIGRGKTTLPHYIVENRGIDPLDCDKRTAIPYEDNLCFFRALALYNGAHLKNLERDTKYYFERSVNYLNFFRNVLLQSLCKLRSFRRFELSFELFYV